MTTETKSQPDSYSVFLFALMGALAGTLIASGHGEVLFVILATWVGVAFAIGTFVFCVYLPHADKKQEVKRKAMQAAAVKAQDEVAEKIRIIRAS